MSWLLMMNLMMTLTFLFMNHPMSMGLILLIQTITISITSGLLSYSYWFSYILFLIMIGGMLVLFIYMTSLASNEMFNMSFKIMTIMVILVILMIMISAIPDLLNETIMKTSNSSELTKTIMLMNENLPTLNKIYNLPNNVITLILINYLLITLIAVVKITSINMGPLRQKF